MKKLFLSLFVLTSISVAAQKSVLLRVNYQTGDTYAVNVTTTSDMGVTGFMNMGMDMKMKVNAVEDGLFKTESQIQSIRMSMEQGGMSMNYDSNKTENLDEMAKQMKMQFDPMMDAKIYTTVNELGATVDTRIEPAIAGMEQMAKNTGNISYPKEELSVGSSWTAIQEQEGMTMNLVYTVSSISNGTVVLDITGDVKGTGTGTIKGQATVDIKSGAQKNSELQIKINVQGTEVSTTVKTTMTKV